MELGDFRRTRGVIISRVLLIPFLTVMLVFGTLIYYFATHIHRQVRDELRYIGNAHGHLIEQFLHDCSVNLQHIACAGQFEELSNQERLAELFERLQERSISFVDLGILDDQGNQVAYVGPYMLKGKNYADAEWFSSAQREDVYISDVFSGYRKAPHFIIVVRSDEGGHPWFIKSTIDTYLFNDLVADIRLGDTAEAYLTNEKGIFQTRPRSGGKVLEPDPNFPVYKPGKDIRAPFTADDVADGRYLYAVSRIQPTGWRLVVRQEIGDAYANLIQAVLMGITIVLLGGAGAVLMGFVFASRVSNQLAACAAEKNQIGSQLIMAGKLAEVGEMSSAVAHEINNPLQVMKGEETYMKDILGDMEANGTPGNAENIEMLRDSIEQVGKQIDRCREITQGLLGFARKSEERTCLVDLNSLLSETAAMVEYRARVENINIVREVKSDVPHLKSDPTQLQQVFLNLLNNAIDALKDKDHGEIRITAECINDEVIVSVRDNGCGIAPENMEKIFLPFYTTKPVGEGTGLGLSTSYSIVERLGGRIDVSSELNVGTVFSVRLPFYGQLKGPESEKPAVSMGGVAQ